MIRPTEHLPTTSVETHVSRQEHPTTSTHMLRDLFADISVMAEFHPLAKALRFIHQADGEYRADVVFEARPLMLREELEADIATIASMLTNVALPDYHAFCVDVESIFHGAAPSGPIKHSHELDWQTFQKLSAYAQYWQERNPREVAKLITFVMAIPVFSCLVGQQIVNQRNQTATEILQNLSQPHGSYMMGVSLFRSLFEQEIQTAYNEAKMLVATFRGTRTDNAEAIVNGMVAKMVSES